MTWIKLDDNAVDHPKVEALSDRAFRWWVKGLSYASRFLTDGVLPPVFWKRVPSGSRSELTKQTLWDWVDPNFEIHDYLTHQSSREAVDRKKAQTADRVKRYRQRHSNGVTESKSNAVTNAHVTAPDTESREQRTESRVQRGEPKTAAASLIMSPERYAQRQMHCAFVGSRIEVPNALHAELRKNHGGSDPEKELQDWYLELNDRAETERWRIPSDKTFFSWFKALYAEKFPTHINGAVKDDAAILARLQAIERGEVKR